MIGVITGLPGAGKTLWALTYIVALVERENVALRKAGRPEREVFYSGIADLKLPWTEIDATKWAECPPGSVVVIDEAQRVFRPRGQGVAVPAHVSALETHRHLGVDLYLITQHPMLIESNVRKLTGLHFHVMRAFGTAGATVHEWGSVKENCDKSRTDSQKHVFKYPKANFELYKSAEVHTHKVRLPMKLFILIAVPFVVAFLGWRLYVGWSKRVDSEKAKEVGLDAARLSGGSVGGYIPSTGGKAPVLNREQYLASFEPRVAGLAYTAPAYDQVTQPVQAPYPAACVQMGARCGCYTQQGTKLATPKTLCEGIVAGGFFVAWDKPLAHAQPVSVALAVPSPVSGGWASLGGSPTSHIQSASNGASDQYGAGGGTGGASPGLGATGRHMPPQ